MKEGNDNFSLKNMAPARFGPRFPAMNNSYDQRLRQLAKQVAKDIGIDQYIREGVYVMLGGPAYETVAELRLLRMLGVDAVGTLLFPLKPSFKHLHGLPLIMLQE
jgi:purine-nucleoside phosphorylase